MDTNDRATVGFTMLAHGTFHAYELSIPVFIVAWLNTFAVSEATLGLVTGAGYALIGLGAVPSGLVADDRGSKLPVVISMLGMGSGFLLLSIAPNIAVVALALLLWGAAASLYHPAGLSMLSRDTHERGSAFAYHGAAGNVGTVVGPFIAILLLAAYGWRVAAAAFVLPAFVGALLASRIDLGPSSVDEGEDVTTDGGAANGTPSNLSEFVGAARRLFTGGFVVVFVIVMVYGLYYRGILTFLPKILGGLAVFQPVDVFGRTVEPSRYAYAGLLFVGVFGQWVGGMVTDRGDTERVLAIGFTILTLSTLAFLPASRAGVLPLIVVCAALGFFIYLIAPVYQATIAEYVDSDTHGLSYGFTYFGMFGIGSVGAAVAGVALTYAGRSLLFVTLALFASISLLLSVYMVFEYGTENG